MVKKFQGIALVPDGSRSSNSNAAKNLSVSRWVLGWSKSDAKVAGLEATELCTCWLCSSGALRARAGLQGLAFLRLHHRHLAHLTLSKLWAISITQLLFLCRLFSQLVSSLVAATAPDIDLSLFLISLLKAFSFPPMPPRKPFSQAFQERTISGLVLISSDSPSLGVAESFNTISCSSSA